MSLDPRKTPAAAPGCFRLVLLVWVAIWWIGGLLVLLFDLDLPLGWVLFLAALIAIPMLATYWHLGRSLALVLWLGALTAPVVALLLDGLAALAMHRPPQPT